MKKKIFMMILTGILTVMMTTAAFAEFVYVTKYGKKYHRADSSFIKGKDVEKLTRKEAEERGLEPSKDFLRKEGQLQKEEIESSAKNK